MFSKNFYIKFNVFCFLTQTCTHSIKDFSIRFLFSSSGINWTFSSIHPVHLPNLISYCNPSSSSAVWWLYQFNGKYFKYHTLFPLIFVSLLFTLPLIFVPLIFAPWAKNRIFPPFNFRPLSNWQTFQYKIPKFAPFLFRSPSILRVSNPLPPKRDTTKFVGNKVSLYSLSVIKGFKGFFFQIFYFHGVLDSVILNGTIFWRSQS